MYENTRSGKYQLKSLMVKQLRYILTTMYDQFFEILDSQINYYVLKDLQ